MKRAFIIYTFFIMVSLLNSCKEDEIMVYDETNTIGSIYFTIPYNTGVSILPTDSLAVKFGFMPATTVSSVETLQVTVTGPIHDKDRAFLIKFDENGSLKEGKHFNVLQESLVIPANQKDGFIELEFYKTEDMKTQKLFGVIELLPNENFSTALKTRKSSLTLREVSVIKMRLQVDDFIEKPYCWDNDPTKYYFDNYIGDYSKAKLDLLIELFDEDMEHFSNPQYAKDNYFESGTLIFWGNFLKFWLEKEAAEGRPQYDENGNEMTAGRYAR